MRRRPAVSSSSSALFFATAALHLHLAASFSPPPVSLPAVVRRGPRRRSSPVLAASASASLPEFSYAPNFITKTLPADPVTRFPPEPNGYLHLGHAKAICFNFGVAAMYGGTCHMRLDDTNPSKENAEYAASILADVRWLLSADPSSDPWSGPVRLASNYFPALYDLAEQLILRGDAYVDSQSAEDMRRTRGTLTEGGTPSPFRARTPEESLELFREMRAGLHPEGAHVLRARIDMSSPNLNLRDPTLYRIKHESHPHTGDAWCIYPMYDYAHAVSDALEGITNSLCTLEFADHRPLYDWVVERAVAAGTAPCLAGPPRQTEFSRLNLRYTVLSKRKLIQLVEGGHVDGWDDPRMPTLSGARRRGLPPAALRLFCARVGISKIDSVIDYGLLEDCAREVMDAEAGRAFAVLDPLRLTITNWDGGLETFEVPRHPKAPERGERAVPFGRELYIERSDFFDANGPEGRATEGRPPRGYKRLLEGGPVRLKFAYVVTCTEVVRDAAGEPVELRCTYDPATRAGCTPEGQKRTKGIVQWVEASSAVRCTVRDYDRLFRTEEPGAATGDFLDDLNGKSARVTEGALVEPSVAEDVGRGEDAGGGSDLRFQFERSGYYAPDRDSALDALVFNRVATLRDTWGAPPAPNPPGKPRGRGATKAAGPLEDVRRVSLRAGTVLSAGPHPDADGLVVLAVACGDVPGEDGATLPRTVVAGIAGKVALESLPGTRTVFLTNLKPAKMRGIESTAVLVAADGEEGGVELLGVPEGVEDGELLRFEGFEMGEPDGLLKSKGALKVWDRVKEGLKGTEEGHAAYNTEGKVSRIMTSKGPVQSPANANIE